MSQIRSVYLSDEEDEKLRALAERQSTSINYVLRVALRILLGLPVGSADRELTNN